MAHADNAPVDLTIRFEHRRQGDSEGIVVRVGDHSSRWFDTHAFILGTPWEHLHQELTKHDPETFELAVPLDWLLSGDWLDGAYDFITEQYNQRESGGRLRTR